MKKDDIKRPVAWAGRVNRSWIVRSELRQRTDEWLAYLARSDRKRLLENCEVARAMVHQRPTGSDPKPWFYAGLFNTATAEEAKRFLSGHRLTSAAVPALSDDDDVAAWVGSLGSETRELLDSLKAGLQRLSRKGRKSGA